MANINFSMYAKKIIRLGYNKEDGHRIFYKEGRDVYATRRYADLRNLSDSYIEKCDRKRNVEAYVLSNLRNMEALVVSEPPYALQCIEEKRQIVAALDDMAQIIGYKVKILPYKAYGISRALKQTAACLVLPHQDYPEGCAITCGRDIYEAYVAMMVLEKNAEVTLKADVLGGAKTLDPMYSLILRKRYLYKYSQAERRSHENK